MSFLVLTEDGSDHAPGVVLGLAKKLLVHLDPRCQTQRIGFEPAGDLDDVVRSNRWRDRRSERVRLYNRVAQKVRNADGFVVHHFDADQRWSDRHDDPNTARQHDAEIVRHVRKRLYEFYRDQPDAPTTEAELDRHVEARMSRFFRLVPHWEIEAWLYQNTDRAAPLCPGEPHCTRTPSCRNKLESWRRDRAALDEVEHPSDQLCFGKRHNAALVQGLPTAEVVSAGKSLAAAVDAMLACDDLLHAIQRTYHPDEAT